MKNEAGRDKRQNHILVYMAWCLLIFTMLAAPAFAQIPTNPLEVESAKSTWQAPDLAALPSDWWSQLNKVSAEEVNQRFSLFLDALEQRVQGLVDDDLNPSPDLPSV